jgi:hypothetical protein
VIITSSLLQHKATNFLSEHCQTIHSNEPAGSHGISIRGKAGLYGFSPCSTFNIQHYSFFYNPVNV